MEHTRIQYNNGAQGATMSIVASRHSESGRDRDRERERGAHGVQTVQESELRAVMTFPPLPPDTVFHENWVGVVVLVLGVNHLPPSERMEER